jgi:glutamine transport system substrate-binding protein
MDFDAVVTSVGKNNIDIAASGLTIKESRKQAVNFSDSYFSEAFQVLIVPTSNTEFDSCKTKADIEAILKAK